MALAGGSCSGRSSLPLSGVSGFTMEEKEA